MTIPTFTPAFPPSESVVQPEVKILKAEFGDGYTQEAGDGLNNVRDVVKLKWSTLLPSQAEAMEQFFKNMGGYRRFHYRLSDSTTMQKWTCAEWTRSRGTPNTFEATFREQFNLDY